MFKDNTGYIPGIVLITYITDYLYYVGTGIARDPWKSNRLFIGVKTGHRRFLYRTVRREVLQPRTCNLAQPCEKKDHLDKITAAVLVWSTYNTSRSSNMLAGFIYVMVEHVDHDFIKSWKTSAVSTTVWMVDND